MPPECPVYSWDISKLDRLQADVTDLRGRLNLVEGRLTCLGARLGVLETFDGEVTSLDRRLDHWRRLARVEDTTILAEPSKDEGARVR